MKTRQFGFKPYERNGNWIDGTAGASGGEDNVEALDQGEGPPSDKQGPADATRNNPADDPRKGKQLNELTQDDLDSATSAQSGGEMSEQAWEEAHEGATRMNVIVGGEARAFTDEVDIVELTEGELAGTKIGIVNVRPPGTQLKSYYENDEGLVEENFDTMTADTANDTFQNLAEEGVQSVFARESDGSLRPVEQFDFELVEDEDFDLQDRFYEQEDNDPVDDDEDFAMKNQRKTNQKGSAMTARTQVRGVDPDGKKTTLGRLASTGEAQFVRLGTGGQLTIGDKTLLLSSVQLAGVTKLQFVEDGVMVDEVVLDEAPAVAADVEVWAEFDLSDGPVKIGTVEGDGSEAQAMLEATMDEAPTDVVSLWNAITTAAEGQGRGFIPDELDLPDVDMALMSLSATVNGEEVGRVELEVADTAAELEEVADDEVIVAAASTELTDEDVDAAKEFLEADKDAEDFGTAPWEGILTIEGIESGDGRMIELEALTWRELPLPLMMMTRNPEGGGGHDGAELCGTIEWMERRESEIEGLTEIWGGGDLHLNLDAGVTARTLLKNKTMKGVSADIDQVKVQYQNDPTGLDLADMLDFDPGLLMVKKGRVMGATLCPFPAFQEAYVSLVGEDPAGTERPEATLIATGSIQPAHGVQLVTYTPWHYAEEGLVASAAAPSIPVAPPAAWFEKPDASEFGPLRVTAEGRVYGWVAAWGTCHIGFGGRCVQPPKSATNYAAFRVGSVLTAEGIEVKTGPIHIDTEHPELELSWRKARDHYSHTGYAAADVTCGEDEFGIWVAGAARPDATPAQIRALRASDVSPDWRNVNGKPLECVAMLSVGNSGFKVPQGLVASAGQELPYATFAAGGVRYLDSIGSKHLEALVASGTVRQAMRDMGISDEVIELREQVAELAQVVRPIKEAAARAKLATLTAGKTAELAADEPEIPAAVSAMASIRSRLARAQALRLAGK